MLLARYMSAALVAATVGVMMATPAAAIDNGPPRKCPGTQVWAQGTGCVSRAVYEVAKRYCLNGPAKSNKWWECICEDGGKVDACGN